MNKRKNQALSKTNLSLSPLYVVFKEFAVLTKNHTFVRMLSYLYFWQTVANRLTQTTEPERNGLHYHTAKELGIILGVSSKIIKRFQKEFRELGILICFRKGDKGKMHYLIDIQKIVEILHEKTGIHYQIDEVFQADENLQQDYEGFYVPEFVPLDLWNEYIHVHNGDNKANGKKLKISKERKKQHLEQLARLREDYDIRDIMRHSITNAKYGFYAPYPKRADYIKPNSEQLIIAKSIKQRQEQEKREREQQKRTSVLSDIGDKTDVLIANTMAMLNKRCFG